MDSAHSVQNVHSCTQIQAGPSGVSLALQRSHAPRISKVIPRPPLRPLARDRRAQG
jgi:hypothetical protein